MPTHEKRAQKCIIFLCPLGSTSRYSPWYIQYYNIASRAAQSNSVHVSVLKISIVYADSVSKSLCQNFCFFARAAIVSAGENSIFRDN